MSGKATRKSVLDVILSGCEETTNEPGKQARCLVPKMVKNGYKSVFAYLSL
jgi:hypothetical protein